MEISRRHLHTQELRLVGQEKYLFTKEKPYTTTYKHEVEDGGQVHVKEGLEVEIVIAETANGKVIASGH